LKVVDWRVKGEKFLRCRSAHESLRSARSEEPADSYGCYDIIFEVVHEEEIVYEDELWLGGNCGDSDICRSARSRFVFVCPKPVSANELSVVRVFGTYGGLN
jgi:hypothetical protein